MKKKSRLINSLIFLGPAVLIFTFIFTSSLAQGVYFSMTNWQGVMGGAVDFIGLDNYIRIFTQDTDFWNSVLFTLQFVLINVVVNAVIAMLLALALTTKFWGNNFIRMVIFLPNMISLVVTGFVWRFLYNSFLPEFFESVGLPDVGFLTDPNLIVYSIVVMSVWQGVGYMMVIYIAGLNGMDKSLLEAARVDGANAFQSFFKITLPQVLPMVSVGVFLGLSGSMRVFDSVVTLTGGGPGRASEVAMLNIYAEAFERLNYGYANAKAILLTLITFVIVIIQMRVMKERD